MVRVLLLDREGRLRVVAARGEDERLGRLLSTRRRAVLRTRVATHVAIGRPAERYLLLLPLTAGGRSIGLIEVLTGSPEAIVGLEVLQAVASQAAETIVGLRERAESERRLRASDATVVLARELLRARTAAAAVRTTIDHVHEYLGAPAIGLLWQGPTNGWEAVRIRGFGARRRAEIRAAIGAGGGKGSIRPPPGEVRRLRETMIAVSQVGQVDARRAGPAMLLTVGPPPRSRRFLAGAATLFHEACGRIEEVDRALLLSRHVDLGIAWTAHELRAPLIGARQAIDLVLHDKGTPAARESLLRSTYQDLSHLAELVDPLLRWSSVGRPPSRHRVDLATLVGDAAELSCRGEHVGRVRVHTDGPVPVRANVAGLRTVVGNLIRNATAYSPPGAPVDVWVGRRGGKAAVVVSDRGPGIAECDRERIFAASTRTETGRGRAGRGLGLFLAKRIVEAHAGEIGVASGAGGSRFWFELPVIDERRQPSVS